ncbi:hypothetical protein [Cellulomonas sp. URHD0024]|uniref:hypothetical protein n=1 Tax=Cellulomonas sp. URHD0024 TaxID=1302620 RepID=UPI0012DD7211|nr:hypothetical protein [Cellulomonas sp. URHD0024]
MRKPFSMLVAVVLAAGLCACGSGGHQGSTDDAPGASHASQALSPVPAPACPTKTRCAV